MAQLAARLAAIEPSAFEAWIDVAALTANDVYPKIWDREDERTDLIDYLRDGFETIRSGFAAAAEQGQGMIVTLQ